MSSCEFVCTGDSLCVAVCVLQVHGWDPVSTYDMLHLRWGKMEDMTVSRDQLVRT